jgi:hypothetical protein
MQTKGIGMTQPDELVDRLEGRWALSALISKRGRSIIISLDELKDIQAALRRLSAIPAPQSDPHLIEALKHYADIYCEGWCKDAPSHAQFNDCGGCKARAALNSATPAQEEK